MLSERIEKKIEKPEQKTLENFHAVWKKPLKEIIQQFYQEKPSAFAELHLRIKKGLPEDIRIAKEIVADLDASFSNDKDLSLLITLKTYLSAIKKNPHELSNELKENVLTRCHEIYNGNKLFKSPTQDVSAYLEDKITPRSNTIFYLATHQAKAVDPWGFHILNDYMCFTDHFDFPGRNFIIDQNPNALYLRALQSELDLFCFSAGFSSLFEEHRKQKDTIKLGLEIGHQTCYREIDDYLLDNPMERKPNGEAALRYYRQALACGLEVALTGLARLYALGLGVKRDAEFAIQLYRMAIDRGIYGALPCDSGDLRILYYSTMASGLNVAGEDKFFHLCSLPGMNYIETEWLIKMNTIDPLLQNNLNKFRKFAIENPNNLFNDLLKTHSDSLERLKYCLNKKDYEIVMQRYKKQSGNEVKPVVSEFSFLSKDKDKMVDEVALSKGSDNILLKK